MQEAELKQRFDDGALKQATATPVPMASKGWHLVLTDKKSRQVVLQRQRGQEREFSTLDAAFSAARRIGFREMTVSAGL
ncbi:hypothetical protein [Ferrimonas marina]|uniref:Plasmid replication protein RepB n=1 Tax=Ferrimonas marina TaxID=299255 RepID=A0A1M5ZWV8_9GAMM|nr:hypothetical protein [Ferrimonas marina]SHI28767.1 hypothetical protein SAMN02745129_0602 [Ferrimonas marina]